MSSRSLIEDEKLAVGIAAGLAEVVRFMEAAGMSEDEITTELVCQGLIRVEGDDLKSIKSKADAIVADWLIGLAASIGETL